MSDFNCTLSPQTLQIGTGIRFGIYRILNLIYLIIGSSGNIIMLITFYKQSKTDRAYGYQVVFTISKTLEIFWFSIFLLGFTWLGSVTDGVPWFNTNYTLMYIILLGVGCHVTLIISSLWLSVAMAMDRVFALLKPFRYKTINHVQHLIVASIGCFMIGLLGAGVYFFHEEIIWLGDRYKIGINPILNQSTIGRVIFHIRLWSRVGGVVLLIILNIIMVIAFKKRNTKVAAMTIKDSYQDQKRKSAEKTLLLINIYQACMMLVNQIPHVTWVTLQYMTPVAFQACYGIFIGPLCDAMVMVTDTVDFFIMMAINAKMRNWVLKVMPKFCQPKQQNQATTAG